MHQADRKTALAFAFRLVLFFAASLMPFPWLADSYTTVFAAAANVVLSAASEDSRVAFSFEPPEHIRPKGTWDLPLRVELHDSRTIARPSFDVRSYSYRPVAMFLALALASPIAGFRRNAVLLGGGLGLMWILTMLFSSLPILSRLASSGALPHSLGLVIETAYQALATPVMVYAMPLLLWWTLIRGTRHLETAPPSGEGAFDALRASPS